MGRKLPSKLQSGRPFTHFFSFFWLWLTGLYSCLTTWVTHFPKLSNSPNRSFLPILLWSRQTEKHCTVSKVQYTVCSEDHIINLITGHYVCENLASNVLCWTYYLFGHHLKWKWDRTKPQKTHSSKWIRNTSFSRINVRINEMWKIK